MGTHSVYPSVVQNDDLIRMHDGGDPLGDDDLRAAGQAPGKPLPDLRLCGRVHRAGGIVQDQHLRLLQNRPGDAEPLFLAAGHIHATLPQIRLITVFQPVDEFVHTGDPAGLLYFLPRCVFLSPAEIVDHRAGKQRIFLQHHGDGIPQGL